MTLAFVHPTAIVDEGAVVQADAFVWHFTHIMSGAEIGEGTSLGQNCFVGRHVKIGPRCRIQNNVSVYEGVELEEGVFCGPSAVFTNDLTPRALLPKGGQYVRTLVRHGATIGANATVVCGITIGEYAMIGAGAVVTSDVPAFALMLGAPARQRGWSCVCGLTLETRANAARCSCGRRFELGDAGLLEVSE